MNIILDAIVCIIAVVFVYEGYKRGLMNVLIRIGCSVVSLAGSVLISSFGAVFIYNNFIKGHIVSTISASLPEALAINGAAKNADLAYNSLPGFATNSLALLGIDEKAFTDAYISTNLAIPDLIESMIRPALETFVMVACSVLFFMILSAIAYAVTKTTTEAIDITNLKLTDKIFGALLGLVQAAMMMILLILLINAMLVILPADNAAQLNSAISQTIIYKNLHYLNIPVRIMSLFGVSG